MVCPCLLVTLKCLICGTGEVLSTGGDRPYGYRSGRTTAGDLTTINRGGPGYDRVGRVHRNGIIGDAVEHDCFDGEALSLSHISDGIKYQFEWSFYEECPVYIIGRGVC